MSYSEWSDEDLNDNEFPDEYSDDEFAADENEELDTRPCPECGADVWEEIERCPHCGFYIPAETSVWQGRSWWWIALGLAGIFAVLWALSLA